MKTNQILQGDVIEQLKTMPDQSINCIVTSPPYFGLRDYGTGKWEGGDSGCDHVSGNQVQDSKAPGAITPGVRPGNDNSTCKKCGATRIDKQIGLEETPEEYIAKLVDLFRELRRVLRGDGVVWLNLGDSFSDKQLLGIPWRIALVLQADGWYLRSDIIWHKANPMPESCTDRPTKAHEYIFLLSKSKKYWYDQDAIREAHKEDSLKRYEYGLNSSAPKDGFISAGSDTGGFKCDRMGDYINYSGRNARTVWTIATKPFPGAHFAVFPPALVEKCLLAGCPSRVCVECGTPWVRVVKDERHITVDGKCSGCGESIIKHIAGKKNPTNNLQGINPPFFEYKGHLVKLCSHKVTLGFAPACQCCPLPAHKKAYRPGVVLDPFFGSGTTGVVAEQLGRKWIGIDLNPEYVEMAKRRLIKTQPVLPGIY